MAKLLGFQELQEAMVGDIPSTMGGIRLYFVFLSLK